MQDQQPLYGRLPNVHYQGVSLEQLRALPDFQALPPVYWLDVASTPSYRYVRQEDPLWSALHQGVLTTGYLAQTLGFYEPQAAKRLGLPKSRASHRHLLHAYERLLLPAYLPPQPGAPAQPRSAAGTAAAAAERHNAEAVLRFNRTAMLKQGTSAGAGTCPAAEPAAIAGLGEGGGVPSASSSSRSRPSPPGTSPACEQQQQQVDRAPLRVRVIAGPSAQEKQQQQQHRNAPVPGAVQVAAAEPLASPPSGTSRGGKKKKRQRQRHKEGPGAAGGTLPRPGAGLGGAAGVAGGGGLGEEEQQKQRLARSLGQQGCDAVCCAWGKAQEPASLAALASLLPPSSRLVETGLHRIDAEDLPPDWGFAPGSLPPLGASPDALLCHAVPAAAGSVGAAGAPPAPEAAQLPLPPEMWVGGLDAAGGAAAKAAAAGAIPAKDRGISLDVQCGCSGGGSTATSDAGSSAGGVEAKMAGLQLEEGGCGSEEELWGQGPASVDNGWSCSSYSSGLDNGICSTDSSNGAAAGPALPLPQQQPGQQHDSNGRSDTRQVQPRPGRRPTEEQWVWEVVEVKNVCPFGVNQRRGGRGKASGPYLVADRGPRHEVKPEWIPQLQMHMLCTGARSALLVSRSATRGLRAFRLAADDAYLTLMLRVLSRFWREHVRARRPPAANQFASWADFQALLTRTLALARGAEVVLSVPGSQHVPGTDARFFLD